MTTKIFIVLTAIIVLVVFLVVFLQKKDKSQREMFISKLTDTTIVEHQKDDSLQQDIPIEKEYSLEDIQSLIDSLAEMGYPVRVDLDNTSMSLFARPTGNFGCGIVYGSYEIRMETYKENLKNIILSKNLSNKEIYKYLKWNLEMAISVKEYEESLKLNPVLENLRNVIYIKSK